MSKITITRDYDWSDAEVESLRERMDHKLTDMGIRVDWQDDTAMIVGRGAKGFCRLHNGGVELDLDLDIFASLFKSTIEQRLTGYLDKLDSDRAGA